MADLEKELDAGYKFLNEGEYNKAKLRFNKVIKEDAECAPAYLGLAEASIGLPKMSVVDVGALYRKAITLEPENPFNYIAYAEFCLSNGILKAAEENYSQAAELDKDNAPLYFNDLAFGYMDNGIKFLERQLNMTSDDIAKNALNYKLKAYGMDNKTAKGICKKLREDKDASKPPEENKKELGELGKTPDGKELLGVLKKQGGDPYLCLALGQLCFDNGLLDSGERFFLDAVGMDPEHTKYYYNDLAASYFFSGKEHVGKMDVTEEKVQLKSFKYTLRSFKIDVVKACELLES